MENLVSTPTKKEKVANDFVARLFEAMDADDLRRFEGGEWRDNFGEMTASMGVFVEFEALVDGLEEHVRQHFDAIEVQVREVGPSDCVDIGEGAVDAEILIQGDDAWLGVTLMPNQDGELDTWGGVEHWCADPVALPADTEARKSVIATIVTAVREAVQS